MRLVVRLLPLLLIYVLVVALADMPETPRADGARYLWFGQNLIEGHYSPRDKVNLWNGPGYPLVLVPLVRLDLPDRAAAMMNIAFMLLAAVYFYLTLRHYVGDRTAVVATYALGLWPPALRMVPQIMSEPLSLFLVCGFVFHLTGMHRTSERRGLHLVLAAAYLGYLALTRVIFGYVILTALLVLLLLYLIRRSRPVLRAGLVFCLAMVLCLPYLIYTHSLTGKVFYWSTAGGMSLYWMSSPYEGEYGDWHTMRQAAKHPKIAENHGPFFAQLGHLSPVEKDDALKQRAIQNIKDKPGKFFLNWIANLGRLSIGYPKSYAYQRPANLLDMVPPMVALAAFSLCIAPAWSRRRLIPQEMWILMLVALIYLAGTSLLSAYQRFQLPLVPIGFLWISFVSAMKE